MKSVLLISSLVLSLSAHAADQFSDKQWAYKNTGVAQLIDLDPLRTYRVEARPGQDINPLSPVKAKKKIIVAVLDTGVQRSHPDLAGVIHRNDSECKALEKFLKCVQEKDRTTCEKTWMDLKNPEVDQDHNGYPLDCAGWSLLGGQNAAHIMGRPDFDDSQGHGTHVAGIIGAILDNNVGVRGVSQNVEILPVQVIGVQPSEPVKPLSVFDTNNEEDMPGKNSTLGDMIARGIIYAVRSGAKVINLSLGWPQAVDSQFMRQAIAEAQERGVFIVAAAGNDSTRALLRPCAYKNVICVGASSPDGAMAHFSNYGSGVDIVAPGVNILSTYPESKRPVRFRQTLGYEFLSGTSQASPFVAGAIAEMLARGVPDNEIYPRLILSARPLLSNLNLLEGGIQQTLKTTQMEKEIYKKYTIAGNMDLQAAMTIAPQPLIVPAYKEHIEVPWDRQSKNIAYQISFVNKWQDVAIGQVKMNASYLKPHEEAVRPWITGIKEAAPYPAVWKMGEERNFVVTQTIVDNADPSQSRIPSELELAVDVSVNGQMARRYVVEADVVVPVTDTMTANDILSIPVTGMPMMQTSMVPIDMNLDKDVSKREYFVQGGSDGKYQMWLLQNQGNRFEAVGGTKIRMEGKEDNLHEFIAARIDLQNNGQSEYVLAMLWDKQSEDQEAKGNPINFYFFDNKMKVLESFVYANEIAPMPIDYQSVFWQKVGNTKRPAWIGGGLKPDKKRTLRDRWENPTDHENPTTRFYYLNEANQLKAVEEYKGYRIIDVIQPRNEQILAGRVPVLLAKNSGSDAKPSYLYSFAVAEMFNGQVENFMELDLFANKDTYRNILDTRVGQVNSLDVGNDEYAGSFWFAEGLNRQQRLSVFDNKNWELLDQQLSAQRSQYDSALWVRAVFTGLKMQGAFVLTNSEVEYHDLRSPQVVTKSMDRYTFIPDSFATAAIQPLTILNARDATTRLPAVFIAEGTGLNRGVKMLVPVFAKDGSAIELVSPARLRFKTARGCKALEASVFDGAAGAHSFDYYCGSKILRMKLSY